MCEKAREEGKGGFECSREHTELRTYLTVDPLPVAVVGVLVIPLLLLLPLRR